MDDYQRESRHGAAGVVVGLLVVVFVLAAALAAVLVLRPSFAQPLFDLMEPGQSAQDAEGAGEEAGEGANGASASSSTAFSDVGDTAPTETQKAAEEEEWARQHQTPRIANCGTLELRSPIAPADLTGVLFHQASYTSAMTLTTELPEADYEKVLKKGLVRVNNKQESGEWLDADALHIWRTGDTTPMDTSIDVGAFAGTTVIAPVTGKVILVRDYMLYNQIPDIEIHIQPDGYDNWDCVLIHTTDPLVKKGDRVEAGVTAISHVRDIEKDLTDVQLGFYTGGKGGNHTHVQVNNADTPGYRDSLKQDTKKKKKEKSS